MQSVGKRILVVDDEVDVLRYLETFLIDNGFDVITATNGKDCLTQAESQGPDLITLDISMPMESGIRVFRDLQENSKTKKIPVIIITGVSEEFKRIIPYKKGAENKFDFFEKPINRDKLLTSIRNILKIK
jgi:DNA-binding response OmpR family regulator